MDIFRHRLLSSCYKGKKGLQLNPNDFETPIQIAAASDAGFLILILDHYVPTSTPMGTTARILCPAIAAPRIRHQKISSCAQQGYGYNFSGKSARTLAPHCDVDILPSPLPTFGFLICNASEEHQQAPIVGLGILGPLLSVSNFPTRAVRATPTSDDRVMTSRNGMLTFSEIPDTVADVCCGTDFPTGSIRGWFKHLETPRVESGHVAASGSLHCTMNDRMVAKHESHFADGLGRMRCLDANHAGLMHQVAPAVTILLSPSLDLTYLEKAKKAE
ncbi:hypothetical protein GGX14DRAFT_393903 [Mycena pura]|uniref:Uncharacterized protein n=1 Tax=Mycena pura TaxID=153505 RepID=A0AAD6VJ65_9AGAR|nr:hypothetical protein GGX14DRAFT_393903 [Mycena pura]